MVSPRLSSGIEERHKCAVYRVDPRKVRALMTIAMGTSECKVVSLVLATVLTCNDMFDLIPEEGFIVLMTEAILATIFGSLPDYVSSATVHQRPESTKERALA
jgi:hypothetical protein